MTDESDTKEDKPGGSFSRQIRDQELRKLRAQRRAVQSIWFGFGMFGLVGWSVAVPTVAGAALGLWLDKRYPSSHSWTLTLLIIGVIVGCANAWYWVARENRQIHDGQERKKDE